MNNDEKNLILDILAGDNLFNKMGLIGASSTLLAQNATWGTASGGKISLASDVDFDFASAGDTAYGITVYASTIALGVPSSFVSYDFDEGIEFNQYDIYTVSGIDLTVE